MTKTHIPVAVFASGTGSNLRALVRARDEGALGPASLSLLICDQPKAKCIDVALDAGMAVWAHHPRAFADKPTYESALVKALRTYDVHYGILAGYMRICGDTLLEAYGGKLINLHPSLLPAFAGKDAIGQALRSNARYTGVTIHFVDAGVDTGPIIAQEPVPIFQDDTDASLAERIHGVEHKLLPAIVRALAQGDVQLAEGRVAAAFDVPIHGMAARGARDLAKTQRVVGVK